MAECAIARCVQERRSFKRELQKWGKNVLFLAGLERVAEELVGQEKWQRLMNPHEDIESKVVVDWEPDDICWFCHSRKQLPPDLAKGVCPIDTLGIISDLNESDGNLSENVYYNSPLLPWYYRDTNPSPSPQSDEPLDLSMGSKSACACPSPNSPYTDNDASTTVLKVPQIPLKSGMKKRFEASGCKRSYTEDELQAALRDIQSGKLGTRRAAVIYGIPRSTLRNKVYKMALERDNGDHVNNNNNNKKEKCTPSSSPSTGLSMDDLVRCNGIIDSKNSTTVPSTSPATPSASESLRQLLRNRLAEKSVVEVEDETTSKQQQLDYNNTLAPLLTQVLANVHELALSKLRSGSAITDAMMKSSNDTDDMCLPLLPDLIRRLAEERFEEETKSSNCNKNNVEKQATNKNNVILKIPSYKPMKSVSEGTPPSSASHSHTNSGHHHTLAGKGIGVSLREIIAKSISQRAAVVNRRSPSMSAASSLLLSPPMTELLNGSSDSSNQDEPPSKKWKTSTSQKNNNTPNNNNNNINNVSQKNNSSDSNTNSTNNNNNKTEKRTRPKRGRYRNYDRDNLAEAVRAVQRGEMSVHRAGSYYGVPHSTLEYKVKERHLLRPRKRELKNNSSNNNNGNGCHGSSKNKTKDATESKNGIRTNDETEKLAEKLSQGSLGNLSFPAHIPIWQSSPFFSLDFSQFSPNHFFASQMMRKLQEDALMHAENSSGTGKDSVSLLNSIIRSSVQSDTNLNLTVSRDEDDVDEAAVKHEENGENGDD